MRGNALVQVSKSIIRLCIELESLQVGFSILAARYDDLSEAYDKALAIIRNDHCGCYNTSIRPLEHSEYCQFRRMFENTLTDGKEEILRDH